MAEGRRMMRLSDELAPGAFEALLDEYEQVLRAVLAAAGGRDVTVSGDTVTASFSEPAEALRAAVAVKGATGSREWSHGRKLEVSIGLDAGSYEPAVARCEELCDAAEGGEIFLSPAVVDLLDADGLGDLSFRDLGDVPLRRVERTVRAYELLAG
jgi:class 3 adenylate cyclase